MFSAPSTNAAAALFILFLMPVSAFTATDTERAAAELQYRRTMKAYAKSVNRYNAQGLFTGSLISEEAKRLKADMEALRVKSERMRRGPGAMAPVRRSKPAAIAPGFPIKRPIEPPPAAPARRPSRVIRIFLPYAVLALLAAVVYEIKIRRPRRKPRVVVRCPGCSRKLGVPKNSKRVRIRCPDCGKQSAYNPKKKAKKERG